MLYWSSYRYLVRIWTNASLPKKSKDQTSAHLIFWLTFRSTTQNLKRVKHNDSKMFNKFQLITISVVKFYYLLCCLYHLVLQQFLCCSSKTLHLQGYSSYQSLVLLYHSHKVLFWWCHIFIRYICITIPVLTLVIPTPLRREYTPISTLTIYVPTRNLCC